MKISGVKINVAGLKTVLKMMMMMMMTETLVSVLGTEIKLHCSCGMNLLNLEYFFSLGCDTVWSGRHVLAFHRNLLPPSSVQTIPMIKTACTIYQTTGRQTLRKEKTAVTSLVTSKLTIKYSVHTLLGLCLQLCKNYSKLLLSSGVNFDVSETFQ
jgi:hypothetical protein